MFFPSIIPADLGDDDGLTNLILQAAFDGRLKSDEGFLSAAGDLATITAASGKDLYLTAAKVTLFSNTNIATSVADEAVLKINGIVVETSKATIDSGGVNMTHAYEFKNIGHKVAATQDMKIEIITLDTQTDAEGFIQAIEVPTGQNPVTYAGA